jgi:hypothetical protein
MNDDFDNEMGLPEDELGGGSATSDSGDLGLGMDAEDEMESQMPGRPSGGARAKGSAGSRPRKRAAAPTARKPASRKAAGGRKKKGAKKAGRKAARKSARKASKKAGGRKKARRR